MRHLCCHHNNLPGGCPFLRTSLGKLGCETGLGSDHCGAWPCLRPQLCCWSSLSFSTMLPAREVGTGGRCWQPHCWALTHGLLACRLAEALEMDDGSGSAGPRDPYDSYGSYADDGYADEKGMQRHVRDAGCSCGLA